MEWNSAIGGGVGEDNGDSGNGRKYVRADLLRMMCEVAQGMEYLHRAGVLHGDLKVCPKGSLRLALLLTLTSRL